MTMKSHSNAFLNRLNANFMEYFRALFCLSCARFAALCKSEKIFINWRWLVVFFCSWISRLSMPLFVLHKLGSIEAIFFALSISLSICAKYHGQTIQRHDTIRKSYYAGNLFCRMISRRCKISGMLSSLIN